MVLIADKMVMQKAIILNQRKVIKQLKEKNESCLDAIKTQQKTIDKLLNQLNRIAAIIEE